MGGNGGALIGLINGAVQRCYDEGAKMEVYDGWIRRGVMVEEL